MYRDNSTKDEIYPNIDISLSIEKLFVLDLKDVGENITIYRNYPPIAKVDLNGTIIPSISELAVICFNGILPSTETNDNPFAKVEIGLNVQVSSTIHDQVLADIKDITKIEKLG